MAFTWTPRAEALFKQYFKEISEVSGSSIPGYSARGGSTKELQEFYTSAIGNSTPLKLREALDLLKQDIYTIKDEETGFGGEDPGLIFSTVRNDRSKYDEFISKMHDLVDEQFDKDVLAANDKKFANAGKTGATKGKNGGGSETISDGSTTATGVWNTVAGAGSWLTENLVEYIDPEGGDRDFKGGFGMVGDAASSIYGAFKDAVDPSRGPLARWGGKITYGLATYLGLSTVINFIPGVGGGFIGQALSIAGAIMVMAISNNGPSGASKKVAETNGTNLLPKAELTGKKITFSDNGGVPFTQDNTPDAEDKNGWDKVTLQKDGVVQMLNDSGEEVLVSTKVKDAERAGFIASLKKGAISVTDKILKVGDVSLELSPT